MFAEVVACADDALADFDGREDIRADGSASRSERQLALEISGGLGFGDDIRAGAEVAEAVVAVDIGMSGEGDSALVALRVDDLDAYIAERGISCTEPVVLGDRLKAAYLRDPEGNLLELQQWLVTRSGEPVPPAA